MFTWSLDFLMNIVYVCVGGFVVFLVGFHIYESAIDKRNDIIARKEHKKKEKL